MRLMEHYVSVQGEGPRTGIPTQFVRFAGCNLRCPGWPCDTPFAIEPKIWNKEASRPSTHDVQKAILQKFRRAQNICLTGGEPLLQSRDDLLSIAQNVVVNMRGTVEMFTNGTVPIPPRLSTWCTFIMDWKLPGSGETLSPTQEETRRHNLLFLQGLHITGAAPKVNAVKFVCKDDNDLDNAIRLYKEMELDQGHLRSYFGAVWGSVFTTAQVVERCLEELQGCPWYLNVQMHNYIWPAHERAR